LIHAISDDPGGVVLLGDMVFDSASVEHRQYFDYLMKPVRDRGIAVLRLMGNHDYGASRAEARKIVAARLTSHRSHREGLQS
jgi:hypothetical protein